MKNLAVFFSGNGSNMQAIIKASQEVDYGIKVKLLICNNANAPGIALAKRSGIKLRIIEPHNEEKIYIELMNESIDLIALAGYNAIIKPYLLQKYSNAILNIHPSLLPLYPGKNAPEQALKDQAKITGCTVHIVTKNIDKGPIIKQAIVPILKGDTLESLKNRILRQEHLLYPKTIACFASHMRESST